MPRRSTPKVKMTWADVLFLHWPVALDQLQEHLPRDLEIDTFNGQAWVGLVPFLMQDVQTRLGPIPIPPIPHLSPANFPECNVRTYVKHRGRSGVWFFSLDAEPIAPVLVARALWKLNYCWSRFGVSRQGNAIDYAVRRRSGRAPWVRAVPPAHTAPRYSGPPAHMHARWRVGASPGPAEPNSLEHFLVERYSLFTKRNGVVLDGRIAHDPWVIREAHDIQLDESLLAAAGIAVEGDPIAFASDGVVVRAAALAR